MSKDILERAKKFRNDIKIPLLCILFVSIGPIQCTYDNYVKWQVAKAAQNHNKSEKQHE